MKFLALFMIVAAFSLGNAKTVDLATQELRTDPCKICNTILQDISILINNAWVQSGFQKVLNSACDLLPKEQNAAACHETVNNYIDKIADFIDKKVLAPENCKTLLHCDVVDASRNFSICGFLHQISEQIPKIVDEAEEICDELPVVELQQTCHDTFAKYKPQVDQIAQDAIKWIADHIPFVHCELPKLAILRVEPLELRSDPCKICTTILQDISVLINNAWVQSGFQKVLNSACGLLPNEQNAAACHETVNNYIDKIADFIDKKVLAPQNCKTLFHCDVVDASRNFSICGFLHQISEQIPKIVDEAEEICDELPVVELQQTCHDTFAKYKPQVDQIAQDAIKWIADHIPFVHCDLQKLAILRVEPLELRSNPCKLCDSFMAEIATLINQKWISESLKGILLGSCSLIPEQEYADNCKQTVENYIEIITNFIGEKILTPDNCVKLLHCDLLDSTRDFSICQALATVYGDMMIVVKESEAVCDELPVVEVQRTCHETYAKYSPKIVEMGQNAVKWIGEHIPFVHCDFPVLAVAQPQPLELRSNPCKICDYVMNELATLIDQKWISQSLQGVLLSSCDLIPEQKYVDNCKEIVQNDIEIVTKFIGDKILTPDNCVNLLHCDLIDSTRDFSVCEALTNIYVEMMEIVQVSELLCDELPVVEVQQTCHETFTKYTPKIEEIGQQAVIWIADHIPFVHCKFSQ